MLRNKWKYDAIASPTKVVWIPASNIQEIGPLAKRWELIGSIEGGDWDQQTKPLRDHYKYKAIKQRFVNGKSWEETGIVDKITSEVNRRGSFDGCQNRDDVVRRYRSMDELFESLKRDGYDMTKHPTDANWYDPVSIQLMDHPMVCIDRDGRYLFAGAFHRVSMAQILDIKIPVWILKRHKLWQLLREEVYRTDEVTDLSTEAKAQLDHPDMQDVVKSELQ